MGRLAHRLLVQQDVAMPLNLTAAGTDLFPGSYAIGETGQSAEPMSARSRKLRTGRHYFRRCKMWTPVTASLSATQNVYETFLQ